MPNYQPSRRPHSRLLADRLDRLDETLLSLRGQVHAAVAQALGQSIGGAVRDLLLPAPPAAEPLQSSWRDRMNALKAGLAHRWQDLRSGTQQAAQGVGQGVGTCWQGARQAVTKVWSRCQFLTRLRTQLLAAAGVGLLAATMYWTGPWLVGLLSGAGCFLATRTVQTVAFVGRLFSGLRPVL